MITQSWDSRTYTPSIQQSHNTSSNNINRLAPSLLATNCTSLIQHQLPCTTHTQAPIANKKQVSTKNQILSGSGKSKSTSPPTKRRCVRLKMVTRMINRGLPRISSQVDPTFIPIQSLLCSGMRGQMFSILPLFHGHPLLNHLPFTIEKSLWHTSLPCFFFRSSRSIAHLLHGFSRLN